MHRDIHRLPSFLKSILLVLCISFFTCFVSVTPAGAMCGDINGDGVIDSRDKSIAANAVIGAITLTQQQILRADVVLSGGAVRPDGVILSNDLAMISAAASNEVSLSCNEPDEQTGRRTTLEIITVNTPQTGEARAVARQLIAAMPAGADTTQLSSAVSSLGGTIASRSDSLGLYLVELPSGADLSEAASLISTLPGAIAAVPNIVFTASDLVPDDPPFAASAPLEQRKAFEIISAPSAWERVVASSNAPIIAVLDTGITGSSPEFTGRLSPGADFVFDNTQLTDASGHGTHVAGIIAAKGNNSQGMAGVCWTCRISPVRVCDNNGDCPLFSILKGFESASDNGAKVINASFSGSAPSDSQVRDILKRGVDYATARGILVVAAAGNNSQDASGNVPASIPGVLAVAASDNLDRIASFSAYGGGVVLAAPGEAVYSLSAGSELISKNGTSAAAAFVSGAAGLLLSKYPALTPSSVVNALTTSASPLTGGNAIGGGRLMLSAALDAAAQNSGTAPGGDSGGASGDSPAGGDPGGSGGITTASTSCPVVSINADSGAGSLRDCITYANSNPGTEITFDPSLTGTTISVTTTLPTITESGTTINGGTENITLSGASCASASCAGITIGTTSAGADNVTIKSLTIRNFNGNGIYVVYGDGITIGGSNVSDRNIIISNGTSGTYSGIFIDNEGSGVIIHNNYIGIRADGSTVAANRNGIRIQSMPSMVYTAHNILGNVISGNTNYGVYDASSGHDYPGNTYLNNIIGLTANGNSPAQNSYGLYLLADMFVVGQPGNGNTISCNKNYGLYIGNMAGFGEIKGNMIGTDSSGTGLVACGADPQDYGIYSFENFIAIGGDSSLGESNIVGGNSIAGILLKGNISVGVSGNYIGTDTSGLIDLGNSQYGIYLTGDSTMGTMGNGIGDTTGSGNINYANTIAFNDTAGIYIDHLTANPPAMNSVYPNSIYSNGGATNKGILLATGAHGGITAPNVSSVACGSADGFYNVTVSYTNTVAAQSTVYLYKADNTGSPSVTADSVGGEGFEYLTEKSDNGTSGAKTMTFTDVPISNGTAVSAYRYNDLHGPGGVSEFGTNGAIPNCGPSTCPVVSSTTDSGTNSLRDCIDQANTDGVPTNITFSVSGTISLSSSLPTLTENGTSIDGAGTVTLSGGGTATDGIVIQSANNAISNLTLINFASAAVLISGSSATGNTVEGNFIGITSASAAGANRYGVAIVGAPGNTIGEGTTASRNVISGNTDSGIMISGSGAIGNIIEGNYIGTNAGATGGAPNSIGVKLLNGTRNNIIVGTAAGEPNIIAYNTSVGISVANATTDFNFIRQNRIYSNTGKGISLDGTGSNNNIAAPSISSATNTGGGVYNISGTATCPAFPCTVELFRTDDSSAGVSADATAGEGYEFLSFATIAAGSSFSFTGVSISSNGTKISTTLTDSTGNTSEFGTNYTLPSPNTAPTVSNVTFTPNSIPNNGTTTTTVTALVADTNGLSTISAVGLNFSAVNSGLINITMYDDGLHGDGAAGDGTYGATGITAPATATAQPYSTLRVTATDTSSATGSAVGTLTVTNVPPTVSNVTFTPNSIPNNGTTTTTVTALVADTNGLSTISAVGLNFSAVNSGLINITMYDDGLHGDGAAGDGTYGATGITAPATATAQPYSTLRVTATDTSSATGSSVGTLTVTSAVVIPIDPPCGASWTKFLCNSQNISKSTNSITLPLAVKWIYTAGGAVNSSPAVSNGKVFFGSNDGKLHAVDALTGASLWTYNATSTISSSPAVGNGMVYFGANNNRFYAVAEATGGFIWATTTGNIVDSSPLLYNGKVVFGSQDGKVYAPNAWTGNPGWVSSGLGSMTSSPSVSNGIIFIGSRSNNLYAINDSNGAVAWSYNTGSVVTSSPVYMNGKIFFGSFSGTFYAIDELTHIPSWTATIGGQTYPSAAAADGVVYIPTGAGKLYAFNESSNTPIWQKTIAASGFGAPSIADSKLFHGSTNKYIYARDISTGNVLWYYLADASVNTTPAIYGNRVYVASSGGKVYCFETNIPPTVANVVFSPSTILSDGSATTTVTATITEPNSIYDIASVTIDISSFGAGTSIIMYDDGAHGDGAAGDSVYGALNISATFGKTTDAYSATVTVKDMSNTTASAIGYLNIQGPTCPVVSRTVDSGMNSLRDCIGYANSNPGTTVTFASSIANQTISPTSALPSLTAAGTVIDGGTNNITLNGTSCANCPGLTLTANNITIKSLTINGFTNNGIEINGGSGSTIGGSSSAQRNIITGNGNAADESGIKIAAAANGVTIRNNYIGIRADGTTSSANYNGIYLLSSSGSLNTISDNVISGNTLYGIYDSSTSVSSPGNTYLRNIIGLTAAGTASAGNQYGMYLAATRFVAGQSGNGNTISCNSLYGIYVLNSLSALVQGNRIGTNVSGSATVACANAQDYGIYSKNSSLTIGGSLAAGQSNTISDSSQAGIMLQGNSGASIKGNLIGTNSGAATGTIDLGNKYGIWISGDTVLNTTGNIIGDSSYSSDNMNYIAFNDTAGIYVDTAGNDPSSNFAYSNKIYSNGSATDKGILLASGAHNNITAPIITKAICGENTGEYKVTVSYTNTVTTASSIIFLYLADNTAGSPVVTADSVGGEGYALVATMSGSGAAGAQSVVFTDIPISGGSTISAYRSNAASGFSEFSANKTLSACIETCPVVSSIEDSGPATLRKCITRANSTPGTTITFDNTIAGSTIAPETELPAITADNTVIEGGAANIEISGSFPCVNCHGITIDNAANCDIRNLTLSNFDGSACDGGTHSCAAIHVKGANASNNRIRSNIIGTDSSNSATKRNSIGVMISGASKNGVIGGTSTSDRNVISNNIAANIYITDSGTDGNTVSANYIGLNNAGTAIISSTPVQAAGVSIANGAKSTNIGSPSSARNVITGSTNEILLTGPGISFTQIKNNYIGTNATGNSALAGGASEIVLDNVSGTMIGGDATTSEGNIISGSPTTGARYCITAKNGSSSTTIRGNNIGVLANNTAASAPAASIGIFLQNDTGTVIGGTSAGHRNIIGGNTGYGIRSEGSSSPLIQGNFIGTNATASTNLANAVGVHLTSGTSNALIGGTGTGEPNTFRFNTTNSISASGATTNFNRWHRNIIYNTGGVADKGIVLSSSANQSIVRPTISYTRQIAADTFSIYGTGSCLNCTIELFRTDDTATGIVKDTVGGEAFQYLASATTNATTGDWSMAGVTITGGTWVSAIAISTAGNSSEFSLNAEAANKPPSVTAITFTPQSIPADSLTTTLINVVVTDPNSTADIDRVQINMTPVNSALGTITLSDTGVTGSGIADDGIFAGYATAATGMTPGTYTLTVTAFDLMGLSGSATKGLNIPNSPPVATSPYATPTQVIPGYAPVAFTVKASDLNGSADIASVIVNLSSAGGPAAFPMFDDGAHGDGASGDGVYGVNNYTLPSTMPYGSSTITFKVTDTSGASGTATTSLYANRPPSLSNLTFTPSAMPANGFSTTNLSIMISDTEGLSDIVSVIVDLSPIGTTPSTSTLKDDGTQNDGAAGDGRYGLTGIMPAQSWPEATYYPIVTVTDVWGRSATASTALNVSNITPKAPTLISTTAATSSVVITWSSPYQNTNGFPLTDLQGHYIWKRYSTGTYGTAPLHTDSTTATNTVIMHTDTDVTDFTTYCYKVTAFNSSGVQSAASSEKCATPVPTPWVYEKACGLQTTGAFKPPSTPGFFNRPNDVTVDAAGNYFVADTQNHRIQKFDSNCVFKGATGTYGIATGTFKYPNSITFNPSNSLIYVSDANNRIQAFDTTDQMNIQTSKTIAFYLPVYVRAAPDGTLYVTSGSNGLVKHISATGAVLEQWKLTVPQGIDIDGSGNVFVADAKMNKIYKISGGTMSTWGSLGNGYTQFNFPSGLAVDKTRNYVFISDTNNDRVMIYDTNGNLKNMAGSSGAGLGQLRRPAGLYPTPSGSIAISDKNNNRVEMFVPPAP